jgi:hypothetical protein
MKSVLSPLLVLFTVSLHAEVATTPLTLTHLRGNLYVVEDEFPLSGK